LKLYWENKQKKNLAIYWKKKNLWPTDQS